jgi:hypothetical protein
MWGIAGVSRAVWLGCRSDPVMTVRAVRCAAARVDRRDAAIADLTTPITD